jgi:hypothetical protein
MKHLILIIILISGYGVSAQVKRDQDLITLKNGNQMLGYIIEQKPGKTIKIFRPSVNDTVLVQMNEIDKLTKVFVESFSDKKIDETDTIIETGRYNNKLNCYQFSYVAHLSEGYGDNFITGFSVAWYRSFDNKYYAGASLTVFQNQANLSTVYDKSSEKVIELDRTINQYQLMFENKFRLSLRPQNKRLTTLFGANVGYVFDNSEAQYPRRSIYNQYYVDYEETKGSFMVQTNLAFKVNPDNNSGFMIEPGYAYYAPITKQYSNQVTDGSGQNSSVYLGYRLEPCHVFTFKLSYFF